LFEVEGSYYFRNLTGDTVHQSLLYPFPDTEKYGNITSFNVVETGDTVPVVVHQSREGAILRITVPAMDETMYRISYGQKIKTGEARYIITTMHHWSKPLEQASYTLTFPDNIHIDDISIPPDSIVRSNEKTVYYWYRENFMPSADFIFNFHHTEK
jgi:hypothetical protein